MRSYLIQPIARSARQRGTAYVLTLAITAMLTVLGLVAHKIAGNQIDREQMEQDRVASRFAAISTLDHVHLLLQEDADWRSTYASDTWYFLRALDSTAIYIRMIDEIDGDFSNDNTHPFLLQALAVTGESYRVYSVELTSDVDGNLTVNYDTLKQKTYDELASE